MWSYTARNNRTCRRYNASGAAAASAILLTAITVFGLALLTLKSHGSGVRREDTIKEGNASSSSPSSRTSRQLSKNRFSSSSVLLTSSSRKHSTPTQRRRLLISNVSHLGLLASDTSERSWLTEARFHPASFFLESSVLNETVFCDKPLDSQLATFYSEPTWLCKNIRVGRRHLPFTDTTTRTQDELTMYRRRELESSGPDFSNDNCGRLPDRGNNVFLLCELLLAQMGALFANPPVTSSVHVPFGNCSLPELGRAILVGETSANAVWHAEEKLWPGFVTDIFCSFSLR